LQELGRALSNAHLNPSTSRTSSPKKLLIENIRPEDESPPKISHQHHAPPSAPSSQSIPSTQAIQKLATCRRLPDNEGQSMWKRGEEKKKLLAFSSVS
jgi:hypothetical protein